MVKAQPDCNNLFVNGDFKQTDSVNCRTVGFQSDMKLDCVPRVEGPGWIFIDETGKPWNGGYWGGVSDHTPGGGTNVLMGDGSTDTVVVWHQSVQVIKDGIYEFSVWFINANVNGKYSGATSFFEIRTDSATGPIILSTGRIGKLTPWTQYTGSYTAPVTDTVGFYIVNFAVESGGNDFGIDDVQLRCVTIPEPCIQSQHETFSVCRGDSIQFPIEPGGSNHEWNTQRWLTFDTPSLAISSPDSSIRYIHTYTDDTLCEHTDTFDVQVLTLPNLKVEEHIIDICLGDEVQLKATGSESYVWWPEDQLSDPSSASPTTTPSQPTTYYVTASLNNGCTKTDSVYVHTQNCLCQVFIPNAFTLNHDNLNQSFYPITNCEITSYHLCLYNRWGEKLFETFDINEKWTGWYRGNWVPMGVYFYTIELGYPANISGRQNHFSGVVHVLK
ncbi:MAG: gliding motility-associated C-terminal domain-containing protein [Flavobacteriales bacterium]|nr:gliding motility-associated C-terminal domain-containing protein [Flavobacteriales bacterium]